MFPLPSGPDWISAAAGLHPPTLCENCSGLGIVFCLQNATDLHSLTNFKATILLQAGFKCTSPHILSLRSDDDLFALGQQQSDNMYSESAWPISGGIPESPEHTERQLLLTGHEDGSVRFWDVTGVAMTPLYKYTTAQLFRWANEMLVGVLMSSLTRAIVKVMILHGILNGFCKMQFRLKQSDITETL